MVNNTGLKSMTFRILKVLDNTSSTLNQLNLLAGNGLTLVTPLNRNIKIRKIDSSCRVTPRNTTAAGARGGFANDYSIGFFFVDFAGQAIISQIGFANLFVPDTSLSVASQEIIRGDLNQIDPNQEFCIFAGGISINLLSFNAQGLITGPLFIEYVLTIWYEDN